MSEQEPEAPQHWPTERMITEGHAAYATTDDLKSLDIDSLAGIAELCEVEEAAPEECIPCWAYAEIQERQKPQEDDDEEDRETPKLDALLAEDPPWVDEEKPYGLRDSPNRHSDPVREIARQAGFMQKLVDEILNGPPIPPKDVSLEDLACLTLASKNWIRLMDAQGLELSPKQQALLDETRQIVSRLSQEDM